MCRLRCRRVVGIAFVAGAVLLQACSLTRTTAPPDPYFPTAPPACTRDGTPPLIDAAAAVLAAVLTIAVAASPTQNPSDRTKLLVATAVTAAAFGGSSGLGFYRVTRCEEAEALWRAEQRKRAAAAEAVVAAQRARPRDTAGLLLVNAWKDAVITLTAFVPETKEEFVVLREHRIGAGQTQQVGEVLQGRDGKRAVYVVRVLSRGQWSDAGTVETQFRANGQLRLTLERDPATARPRVSARWAG